MIIYGSKSSVGISPTNTQDVMLSFRSEEHKDTEYISLSLGDIEALCGSIETPASLFRVFQGKDGTSHKKSLSVRRNQDGSDSYYMTYSHTAQDKQIMSFALKIERTWWLAAIRYLRLSEEYIMKAMIDKSVTFTKEKEE